MLEPTTPAPPGDSETSAVPATPPATPPAGSRSARKKKRGLFHRSGIVAPALVVAVLLVVVVLIAARLVNTNGRGAAGLFPAIDSLGHSTQVAALEQERQTIIAMNAAASTLTVDSKPAMANPTQIQAGQAAQSAGDTSGGTGIETTAPPANPTSAEQIGRTELADFGFSETTQWPCLYDIWERESGWNVYAENPSSGAYGIPQSLPGDKMASAGADWETNPTTQIIWGLGYIKSVYGTPCAAWQNEVDNGYY
ncbi:MAG: hypothetical protein ABSA02_21430 [Trebonia sp.]|jgi:hypothetical protein